MSTTTPTNECCNLGRAQSLALLAGVIGLAVCVLGGLVPLTRPFAFRAWLVAFNLCLGISVGSLVILMLQYLTGGAWGFVLRRPLEAATRTLPLLALLYLPLLIDLSQLYLWADPAVVEKDVHLQHKAPYFELWFVLLRAGLYLGIWNVLSFFLNRWSRRMDDKRDVETLHNCENTSAPGLILYVITITFFSIDYIMSLEPHWYSTIFGAMFGMGQVLSALAFAIAIFALLADRPPLEQVAREQNLRDLGSLLLAFVMVWAYLGFSQFLLIWSGNLPEEVPWYQSRLEGGWQFAGLGLILFHFALPFVLLLSVNIKRNRRTLAAVAILVLGMRIVDLLWLIVPAFHHRGEDATGSILGMALYPAAVIGIGGVWLSMYLRELQRLPLLPVYSPAEEGASHGAVAH